METTILVVALTLSICVSILNYFYRETRYFNTNRFRNSVDNEIVPIKFYVKKIEEDFTQYEDGCIRKPLWKYTVECFFFFKKDKNFIVDKYVFWDEPEKYKVGDILTLTNIKQ